ncbi:TonB-dependent receptor [bacterium]|nr:MAG: TonB-dependent receptor [bacterium]
MLIKLLHLTLIFVLSSLEMLYAKDVIIKGKVLGDEGYLKGAHVKWHQSIVITDSTGSFTLKSSQNEGKIIITHLGYERHEQSLSITKPIIELGAIELKSNRIWSNSDVVVTATRTSKDMESVAQPVSVVSKKELAQSGSLRLNDILMEQVGITLTSDHGTGVQMQGMDADYSLILIDGQPVIGRTSGTLDLTRITVGNIKQIEIVKGPSSALWGSDALGGVINIITEKPKTGFTSVVSSRIGSYGSQDYSLETAYQNDKLSQSLFLNGNTSNGYKLNPNIVGNTVPEFLNYTAMYKGSATLTNRVELGLRARLYHENQENKGQIIENDAIRLLDERAKQYDYSLIPTLKINLNSTQKMEFIHNSTWFGNTSQINYADNGSVYSESPFNQRMHRSELQWDAFWNSQARTTSGLGYTYETLEADRYVSKPVFKSYFGFTQLDWDITSNVNITAGLRGDYHSEYSGELSPKFGLRYELKENLHIKMSIGNGFKAPEFRQLFLNFTNPTSGYSVFGTSTVEESVQELQERGELALVLIDASTLQAIQAERSFSINVGLDYSYKNRLRTKVNVFRNTINNLIDSQPIAIKTNNQSVYTYFNLNEIYTQGIEAELHWDVIPGVSLMSGYSYLQAMDQQVIDQINSGAVYRRNSSTNIDERVQLADYGGLFNRSRHSGTLRLFATSPDKHWETSIRLILRGRYGFMDKNNNQILDQDNEYEKGYTLTNISLANYPIKKLRVQLGVDNLFDFTRPNQLSFLPGRLYYIQLNYNFK